MVRASVLLIVPRSVGAPVVAWPLWTELLACVVRWAHCSWVPAVRLPLCLPGSGKYPFSLEPIDGTGETRVYKLATESKEDLDAWLEAELGLTGPLASLDGAGTYTAQLHNHRYAAWCSARAAGRGLAGSTNTAIRNALERSDLPSALSGPSSSWPSTPDGFDETHQHWCEQILGALLQAGISKATFGRAAKIVAIYLKTRVVCGGGVDGPLRQFAHPPIDRVLLQALAKETSFSKSHRPCASRLLLRKERAKRNPSASDK